MAPLLVTETFDSDAGIARIVFNRPEVLNAIDIATARAFRDAVLRVTALPGLRCIVLSGAGRAFVAGGDVASFQVEPAKVVDALLEALHPAVLALRACPAPVLAVVQGAAAGAGLSLALAADYLLAGDKARFVIAYDRIGAPPDCGGTWFLPHKIGRGRAFAMMLLGPVLDADGALAAGIASEVVPQEELEARAEAVARKIASGPTAAFGHFKRLIDDAFWAPLSQHLEKERAAFLASTHTADFREGVSAFLAKREPEFKGS
jgi:2-(1,2-epoxy-1,2-dihydrophenyl)acetyl-CoA isomerase